VQKSQSYRIFCTLKVQVDGTTASMPRAFSPLEDKFELDLSHLFWQVLYLGGSCLLSSMDLNRASHCQPGGRVWLRGEDCGVQRLQRLQRLQRAMILGHTMSHPIPSGIPSNPTWTPRIELCTWCSHLSGTSRSTGSTGKLWKTPIAHEIHVLHDADSVGWTSTNKIVSKATALRSWVFY
jgi:hypothetical protein